MELLNKLKALPNESGIYQYFDSNGKLLYVGKAKSLKNRVKSYFKFTPFLSPADKLSPRIFKMVSEVENLEYIVVPTEQDALILENSLIKQLKPKYNVLLRDDKTFPYIYIDLSQEFPRFEITRKVVKGKNIKYFGPFSSGANELLEAIYSLIPLVQKKSCVKSKKACMFFQIGKCLAPCEGKISPQDYSKLVKDATNLLNNKQKIVQELQQKMDFFAENLRFEEAKELRDAIVKIKKLQTATTLDFANLENIDIIAASKQSNKAVCIMMFVRNGKLVSSAHKFFKDELELDLDEIFERTISNYYKEGIPNVPQDILVSEPIANKDILEEFIKNQIGHKVNISTPQIGKKKEILQIAVQNCEELLRIESLSKNDDLSEQLKELFDLYNLPTRIEVFDNSHMMGQAKVGAMVVWENGFKSKDYRHYNLSELDEFHQMQEMLTRRALNFNENPPPDLWIIDGGKTLMNLAYQIIQSSGAHVDVIGIAKEKRDAKAMRAKGKAKDILHSKNGQITLLETDKRLQFIQKLRDEAHRFAITFHKKQKQNEDKQISLLGLKGFGEAKIKKLLNYFGTFEAIKSTNINELKVVINEKDATLLFNFFQGKNSGDHQNQQE